MATAGPRKRTGSPGNKWFSGYGEPKNIEANPGDMYIDLETGDIYVFE